MDPGAPVGLPSPAGSGPPWAPRKPSLRRWARSPAASDRLLVVSLIPSPTRRSSRSVLTGSILTDRAQHRHAARGHIQRNTGLPCQGGSGHCRSHAPPRRPPHQSLHRLRPPLSVAPQVEGCVGGGALLLRALPAGSPPSPRLIWTPMILASRRPSRDERDRLRRAVGVNALWALSLQKMRQL